MTTIIERLKRAGRRHPWRGVLLPAGAGHPDFHAREPRAVPIHAHRRDTKDVSLWAGKLAAELQKSPVLRDVASEAQDDGLRMNIAVDRELAGRLGVSLQAVTDTLNDAFGQRQISTIYAQSNQYRVILEAMPHYQLDPNSLSKLYVPASGNQATQQSTR